MKRSTFKPRTSPMSRTSKPKAAATTKAPAKRSTLKTKGPKMTPIRKSAKGENCTMRIPNVCNGNRDTVVWAHSNRAEDGKGMGMKARDEEGCYACVACHSWLDGGYAGHMPRSLVETYFDLARSESQAILKRKGLMP